MYIDLTLELSRRIPPFPGDPKMEVRDLFTIKKHGVNEKRIAFNSHFSTHIDSPFHMLLNGKKLDTFSSDIFFGKATILNVCGIKKIEETHMPSKITTPILLFYTNHISKLFHKNYFQKNPVIALSAAKKIIKNKIKIIGIDSFTPDNYPYLVHKILFRKNILILENLVNLHLLKKKCELFIAPLKIKNADGAPTRVFAKI